MVLALMIGAYSAYARFAVPMIKGPVNQVRRTTAVAPTELTEFNDDKSRLLHLLPAAAWELGQCKTLFTSQGTLLFQEMERLDDEGNYSLKPFSMILNDHGSGSAFAVGLDPNVPPTVLRCGEAKLKFDGPITMTGGSKTSMQAALLSGEVTIFRPSPDPQKDETLKLITQNVQLNANRIFTLGEVAFSFGPHRGSGKNLTMELTHEAGTGTVNRDFSSVNGVSTIKLATLNSLLIEPAAMKPAGSASPALPQSDALPTTPAAMFSAARVPVEIFCKGPFEFDYLQRLATFTDTVYVEQKDSFGDNLNCETLFVEFASKDNASNVTPDMGAASIGLKRLRAVGDSQQGKVVTLIANSRKMKVTGGELTYDAAESLIRCNSDRQVTIASPQLNVKAKELSYRLSTDGSLGDLDAVGPGEFFRKAIDPKENLFTRWQNKLTIRRRLPGDRQDADANEMAQKLIVIDGDADVLVQETTRVTSDRLNIAVFEIATVAEASSINSQTQPSKTKWQYLPAEIFADDAVTIRSPSLDGEAGKLLVTWPRPNPNALKTHQTLDVSVRRDVRALYTARKPQTGAGQNIASISPRTNMRSLSLFDSPAISSPTSQSSAVRTTVAQAAWQDQANAAVFDGSAEPKTSGLKQYVRFKGDEVRLKLDGAGKKAELSDLKIDGNVVVHQYENRGSEEKPLRISGDSLRVVPQGEKIFRMVVAGLNEQPAIVDAQGLLVSGSAIHLDQESNKVWVDGAGEMKVRQATVGETNKPAKSSEPGAIAPTGDIDLQWAGGMVFDGSKIYFERNVMMTSFGEPDAKEKSITKTLSQALSIALLQKVNFQKLSGDQSIGEVKMAEMVLVNHIPEAMRVFKDQDGNPPAADARFNTPDAPIIFQNESFGPTGKLVQQRRIAVPQATINAQTNTVVAAGPGKIFMHVVPTAGEKSSDPSNPTAQSSSAFGGLSALSGRGRTKDPNEINFLQVNFEQQLVADLTNKQLEISGNVRTAFAPVKRFSDTVDPDGKERLAEGAVKMQCAKILLSQWQPTGLAKVQNEMVATGNVHITSAGFDSVSERLSYNDRNDQLVIEGTARSPAQLFHRPTPRSEKQQMLANKIIYHPSTGMAETQGVQGIDMNMGK